MVGVVSDTECRISARKVALMRIMLESFRDSLRDHGIKEMAGIVTVILEVLNQSVTEVEIEEQYPSRN